MHYVYFLELSNGNIYVGFSSNLKQRIKAHNDAKVPATAGFLPAKLKSYVAVDTKEKAMALDEDTWLRGRAWALWKATFELCNIADKNSPKSSLQKRIIDEVINE